MRASQVDHFQPYYTFNNKHMIDLRIGAAILHEAIQTAEKEEDEGLKLRTAKAEEEIRVKKVCSLCYEDRPMGFSYVLGKGSLLG